MRSNTRRPTAAKPVKGFWFTNLDGNGFVEHEPTDITQYDTNDTSQLVWFTVPKATGKPVWLPPYITDNLDKRVISYNVPIYYEDEFIGVAGIEIDCSTMAEQVRVAWGIADYDPERDESVIDVTKRADRLMYDNKCLHKEAQAGTGKAEEKPASDEPAIERQTNKEPADAESE